MFCNCCGADNAPMALYKDYWICDDCVERFGSFDNAAFIVQARKIANLDNLPKATIEELNKLYNRYKEINFPTERGE